MDTHGFLTDALGRIREATARAVEGMDADALAYRPDPDANSIGWLIWHLARVQDHHVSDLAGIEQAWVTQGWAERFSMSSDAQDIGYGHSTSDVGAVRPRSADLLVDYLAAVTERTLHYVATMADAQWDDVIDDRWDPPVTAGVRMVSVINDSLQHAGQANYVRGLYERRSGG